MKKKMTYTNPTKCGEISLTINIITGDCTGHEKADWWFLEAGGGIISERRKLEWVAKVKYVTDICNTCPEKQRCLAEGMKKENLPYGIWGGKMAGVRLQDAGIKLENTQNSDESRAIKFSNIVMPLLEVRNE